MGGAVRYESAALPPTVAEELAPAGVLRSRTTALSVAEELLQPDAPALDDARRQQLERQAWWAAMWRDPESPYEKLDAVEQDPLVVAVDPVHVDSQHAGRLDQFQPRQQPTEHRPARGRGARTRGAPPAVGARGSR